MAEFFLPSTLQDEKLCPRHVYKNYTSRPLVQGSRNLRVPMRGINRPWILAASLSVVYEGCGQSSPESALGVGYL